MISRQLALETLLEWEHGEVYAQDLVERCAVRHNLAGRDTALLQSLVFSTLRNIHLLDVWTEDLCENRHLEDSVHWLLRMGLAQLLLLDHPPHAAVNETVSLAPEKARGLVNAVLRRTLREKDRLLAVVPTLSLAERYSHPDWLIERWVKQYGAEAAEKLCIWNQQTPQTYIRVNRLHPQVLDAAATSHLKTGPVTDFFEVNPPPLPWLVDGLVYTQDPSTATACYLLNPQPGEVVLDACAAPGGKTAMLSQLMNGKGSVLACDNSQKRLKRLNENLSRLHVKNASVHLQDWLRPHNNDRTLPATFDRILIDAPCSNTGVMRRRIDVRWRLDEETFDAMQILQIDLIRALLPKLNVGGSLVYSTCSLDHEENDAVVEKALKSLPGYQLEEVKRSLPWVDGMDGAYAARIVKL